MADASLLSTAPAASAAAAADLKVSAARHDGLPFYQYMIAGSIAGVVEHTAMFPVDTVKTRIQAAAGAGAASVAKPCCRLALESPLGLYRGVAAMALGAGPAHAVYFSVYEIAKESLASATSNPNNPAVHAASGVLATVASDAVLTPMDTVKQRLQLHNSPYKGIADCVARMLRQEGPRAFYVSYKTTVLMNAPFTAVHFATYEAAKRVLAGRWVEQGDQEDMEEGLAVHATAGAAAGALAAVVTTPLDVVKTQLQCQGVCGVNRFSTNSIGEVVRTIFRHGGYSGLMRGWMPRMLFHSPAAAICWSTYEASKSFFHRFNENRAML